MKPATPASSTGVPSSHRRGRLGSGVAAAQPFTLLTGLPTLNPQSANVAPPSPAPMSAASSCGSARSSAVPQKKGTTTADYLPRVVSPRQEAKYATEGSHTPSTSSKSSGGWQSGLLAVEVRLRELAADGPSEPPAIARIDEVLRLFDTFVSLAPSIHTEILRLFRVEFCRAIFSGTTTGGSYSSGQPGDSSQVPFFDKIDKMLREANVLQAELEAVETDHNVADLKRQLAKLQALIPFYEQEVGRITRENDRHVEELQLVRQDFELTQSAHDKAFRNVEDELRKISAENRELQLQVFRLSKDSREQLTGQSMYVHMKQQKADRLQSLFSKGDEQAGLLLLCHQLENAINSILTEVDLDYTKAIPSELSSLRTKLNKRVALLLEELHFSESRLEQLNAPSMKTLSTLRASALYDLEVRSIGIAQQNPANVSSPVGSSKGKSPAASFNNNNNNNNAMMSSTTGDGGPLDIQQKRLEWVKQFLGNVVEHRDIFSANSTTFAQSKQAMVGGQNLELSDSARLQQQPTTTAPAQFPYHTTKPGAFLQHLFTNPMLDITSGSKFMVGIDLHAYGTSAAPSHIRTINYIDPTAPIEVPPRTTHVKVKFVNPLVRSATSNLGEDDAAEVEEGALSFAMEWSPLTARNQHAALTEEMQRGRNPYAPEVGKSHPGSTSVVTSSSEPAHWKLYRTMFFNYRPYLPRVLDTFQIDFLMLQVSQRHMTRLTARYKNCRAIAQQRSTNNDMARVVAERLFRDEYVTHEFQISLVEVLEGRYGFPELVGKTMYELLTSLEALGSSVPQAQMYLDCISGVAPFAQTYLTSSTLYALSSYWPVNLSFADQEVHQKDVMAVLRYLYPAETAVRVDLDALMSELLLSCQEQITLRATRNFFVQWFATSDEAVVKKFAELLNYRSEVVQWNELEFNDMFDILKVFVGDESAANAIALFIECCCVTEKSGRLPVPHLSALCAAAFQNVRHAKR